MTDNIDTIERESVKRTYAVDPTTGSLTKGLLSLAIPFILAMLVETLFNITNMLFVSRLGSAAIAAVSFCGIMLMLTSVAVEGMSGAAVALIARRVGEKDLTGAGIVSVQIYMVGILFSFALGILGYIYAEPLMRLIGANDLIVSHGLGYCRIYFIGMTSVFLLFITQAILRGAGEPIMPFVILVISALANIVLDFLLIFGIGPFPKMGVAGAGLATIIARGIGSIIGIFFLFNGYSIVKIRFSDFVIDFKIIKNVFKIAFPSMGRMSLNSFSRIALMKIVTLFGTSAVAAYGIGLRLDMLVFLPGLGFAGAVSTMVGQNLGAKSPERAEKSTWIALGYNTLIMSFFGILFFFMAKEIIGVFDKNQDVLELGETYLKVVAPSYFLLGVRLVLGGALRGAGDNFAPMVISLITLFGIQIPLAYYLSKWAALNTTGIWLSIAGVNFFEALLLSYWFKRGGWKEKIF
ncbi:MAG: hypothetical protein A2149_00560 [Candidatus Schekmanbacteria bacterium RBG_16_38_11]|uniref:Multidrug-efflux transporter n=1 Tax=Candidatus Schekmanbacteria bacterium RBG_16_38_11 TaxID=1817880 RepID=A0A1F7RTL6_9BACT|nr:MAG: hypothetical protein A2149_00560 [Candidatus Schekmanbacteria bacterium RBG_16_38_11]